MNFRWRLFLCLAFAVLAGTTVEAITDYLESRASLREQVNESLAQLQTFTDTALFFENGEPQVDETLELPFDSRVRVLRDDDVLLELDRVERAAELALREQDLPDGLKLELAVDTRTYEDILNASFRRDLTDDVIQVLLSTIVAFALSSFFLRPLQTLNKAMSDMAQQKFPEPTEANSSSAMFRKVATMFAP
jgi:hypothetical protein